MLCLPGPLRQEPHFLDTLERPCPQGFAGCSPTGSLQGGNGAPVALLVWSCRDLQPHPHSSAGHCPGEVSGGLALAVVPSAWVLCLQVAPSLEI